MDNQKRDAFDKNDYLVEIADNHLTHPDGEIDE